MYSPYNVTMLNIKQCITIVNIKQCIYIHNANEYQITALGCLVNILMQLSDIHW